MLNQTDIEQIRREHEEYAKGYKAWIDDKDFWLERESDLLTHIDRLKAEKKAADLCDVCTGEGKHDSGKPCICGGSGKSWDEKVGLRLVLNEVETKLEASEATVKEYKIVADFVEKNILQMCQPHEWSKAHDIINMCVRLRTSEARVKELEGVR